MVDLDAFGSAAQFLDAAFRSVKKGSVLSVVSTDIVYVVVDVNGRQVLLGLTLWSLCVIMVDIHSVVCRIIEN